MAIVILFFFPVLFELKFLSKAQKRKPRALSLHTLYSLILLFLGVVK